MTRKNKPAPSGGPLPACCPVVNLTVSAFHIQPVVTLGFQPPTLGAPIMREGFVTDTGFLVGSPEG
jgi:hypothetical protein